MPGTFTTASGATLQLGRELGRGGEGSVFDIPALPAQVAKIYHERPEQKKQSKLTFMAGAGSKKLLSYVAWPQETLHPNRTGPVVGFLMPKVTGREPIHTVYSPAHRRQERPKAAWDFLLYVARNTAVAFEVLHDHGHVLGDVNQGNVMVGGDSQVVLIDSDSFQVIDRGTLHHCEVGVSHFTPPELQGLSSFAGFTRTTNHDNFGLALLIFHLLFGGRHPYSGVPLRSGVGDSLEADIKAFRYAYSRDAQTRGIAAPPRAIPLAIVPDAMEAMFQLAFTEKGSMGGRPTAKQWVAALDDLRGHLKRCSVSAMHLYSGHQLKCPWCSLEQQGVAYFIDLGSTFVPTSTGFVLARVWAVIEAVPAPAPLNLPDIASISVSPKSLPEGVPGRAARYIYRAMVLVAAVAAVYFFHKLWFLGLVGGIVGWVMAGEVGSAARAQELKSREDTLSAAREAYAQWVARTKSEAGPEGFHTKRGELSKLRDEHSRLNDAQVHEIDKLQATAHTRQKEKFLDSFFIDAASIPGVGPARKAALRSFGIETAADVTRARVQQVRGFGHRFTEAMVDWRASCERRFQFKPNNAVSEADKNSVRAKYAARRVSIEAALNRGAAELQTFQQESRIKLNGLQPRLDQLAIRLAQAQADVAAL